MARRNGLLLSAVVAMFLAGLGSPASAEMKGTEAIGEMVSTVKIGTLRERLDSLQRLANLRDIRQIREWKVVEVLQELAAGDNPRISRRAVKALGDLVMGADRSIKEQVRTPLVKILEDGSLVPLVRVEAANQLGRIMIAGEFSDAQGVNALARLAKAGGNTPEITAAALLALGNIGDKKGKDAIRTGLSARDDMVKEAALEALGKFLTGKNAEGMMDDSLSGVLMRLLADKNLTPDAKEKIIDAVGRAVRAGASKTQAEGALIKILKTEDRPATVIACLKALGATGSAQAPDPLIATYQRFLPKEDERADSSGAGVRAQVCATSGELFDEWCKIKGAGTATQSARKLSELLTMAMINDKSDAVRKEAVVALGNLYDKRYDRRKPVAALIALLAVSTTDDIKAVISESIEMLTGRSFGMDADRWDRWFRANEGKLSPLQ